VLQWDRVPELDVPRADLLGDRFDSGTVLAISHEQKANIGAPLQENRRCPYDPLDSLERHVVAIEEHMPILRLDVGPGVHDRLVCSDEENLEPQVLIGEIGEEPAMRRTVGDHDIS
jgi:hypothetical protein